MGRSIGRRLQTEGLTVELHDDHFAQGTPDTVWLPIVGAKRWIVLTKDTRIRYRPAEKQAFLGAGVRVFAFTSGNLSGPEMADAVVKALRKMRALWRHMLGRSLRESRRRPASRSSRESSFGLVQECASGADTGDEQSRQENEGSPSETVQKSEKPPHVILSRRSCEAAKDGEGSQNARVVAFDDPSPSLRFAQGMLRGSDV